MPVSWIVASMKTIWKSRHSLEPHAISLRDRALKNRREVRGVRDHEHSRIDVSANWSERRSQLLQAVS